MNDKTILLVEDSRDDKALDGLPGNRNSFPTLALLEQDLINPGQVNANNCVRRMVDCKQFSEAVCQPGLYRRLLNESPAHRGV
jgi:hypothetical protein